MTTMTVRLGKVLRFLAGLVLVLGCSMGTPMSSEFGATQGGVKDMGPARELILNGQVPPPEAFLVEGMFSEHDLPLQGAPCSRTLCLRAAAGVAPTLDGESSAWVQVGLSSTINPATYERPSLTIVATVDVSGSMGWNYSDKDRQYQTPGTVARELLGAIAARLGPEDRIAIVTFESFSKVALGLTRADDPAVSKALDDLKGGGATNMRAGLDDAYRIARDAVSKGETRAVRVILLTDEHPNVGETSAGSFEQLVAAGADDSIGLSVFGIGLGLGQKLFDAMSHLRGGNAFSVFKTEQVAPFMEENWPWMFSPLAYDLAVELVPPTGFQVAQSFGFPQGTGTDAARLQASTVFLSKKRGALLVRVARDGSTELAGVRVAGKLTYQTLEDEAVTDSLEAAYLGTALDAQGQYFDQLSARKAVALAILVSGMQAAAAHYGTDPAAAAATMKRVESRATSDAQAVADPTFDREVTLARDLLALMENGAPQGDLYGQR